MDLNYDNDESNRQQQQKQPPPHYPEHSEVGEFHGDAHETTLPITKSTYVFAFCAALNSCNLGYDIGVNTSASPILQDDMELTDVELEIFMGSMNLFAMIGAFTTHSILDQYAHRHLLL